MVFIMNEICDLTKINHDYNKWGGKAIFLSQLANNGFNVPKGYVISSDAFIKYYLNKENNSKFLEELKKWLKKYFDDNSQIIFRSSANVENKDNFAACGVFESVLHSNTNDIWNDLCKVWGSVDTEYSDAYYNAVGLKKEEVRMAVIIQRVDIKQFSAVIQTYDIVNNENNVIVEYMNGGSNSIVDGKEDARLFLINAFGEVIGDRDEGFSDKIIEILRNDIDRAKDIFGGHLEIEAQIGSESVTYLQVRKIYCGE